MRAICRKVNAKLPGRGAEGSVRRKPRKARRYDNEYIDQGATREEAAITKMKVSRAPYQR